MDISKLSKFGVDSDAVQKFQVLCLPANLERAATAEELVDADHSADLSKRLKREGLRCGNSYDLGLRCGVITKRGADLWLGFVWILDNVAIPTLIAVVCSWLSSRKQRKGGSPTVHLKLRVETAEGTRELDFSGDGESFERLLSDMMSTGRSQEEA